MRWALILSEGQVGDTVTLKAELSDKTDDSIERFKSLQMADLY